MKNFKLMFIEALTSNKYPQTTECLYDKGCFDALGLACFIAGFNNDDLEGHQCLPGDVEDEEFRKKLRFNLTLPQPLKQRHMGSVADKITLLNDNGKSFLEIADWIKENLDEEMNFKANSSISTLKQAA